MGICVGSTDDKSISPDFVLRNADFSTFGFDARFVSQDLISALIKNINPRLDKDAINQMAGLPLLLITDPKPPRPEKGTVKKERWAACHQPNFLGRGVAKGKLIPATCHYCGNHNRSMLFWNVTTIFQIKAQNRKSSGGTCRKPQCASCYQRFCGKTPLTGRRPVHQFDASRYNNRPIKLCGLLTKLREALRCDIRDIWAMSVPCSGATLAPKTAGYRRRGMLFHVHPWRVPFKVNNEPSSMAIFLALFRATPLRAVSLFHLSASAYNIWNQDWAVMRSWGRFCLNDFSKRFTSANLTVHDASLDKQPSESALFLYLSPGKDGDKHGLISIEMAFMIKEIICKTIALTVILDSPTQPSYPSFAVSAKTLEGMTRENLRMHGLYIVDADQLTWGILYTIVKMARNSKDINDLPVLNVTLQGSYIKSVRGFETTVDGFRLGCCFSEIVTAVMDDTLPGSVQMGSFYDPVKEDTALYLQLAREEGIAFQYGTWPPLNPSPINPKGHGCDLSLVSVIDAARRYPASFEHYNPDEYPPLLPKG